ncbi:MAG: ATP-binding cassette domain-containing protein [Pseudomonadota bacterium]
MTGVVVTCRDVWKVFGETTSQTALAAVLDGSLSKDEALDRHGLVLGVAGVDLEIREGEIFCIMGLSGSGKSTLLRHINGLIRPTSGRILVRDRDITGLSERNLRVLRAETFGMVFQNVALLPHRTVRDNVAFGLELRGQSRTARWEAAEEAISLVQLDGWGDRYPQELSGGMQQRVGLARALAIDAPILLMDEPFSALDPLIRKQLQSFFLDISRRMKKTTLFITHDLDEAIRLGDRIAVMKDGKFIQVGTAEDIAMRPRDAYVEEFVVGLSPLKVLAIESIMRPVDITDTALVTSLDSSPVVRIDQSVEELVDIAASHDGPVAVVGKNDGIVGTVTHRDIVSSMRRKPSVD